VEDVICRHEEHINCATHIGTCKRCGQQLQYDEYERKIAQILKRGELNGVQTMVKPITLKEEAKQNKEHEEAQESPAPSSLSETTPAPAASTPAPKPRKKQKMVRHQAEYFEENKEAIIQDYHALNLRVFFKKWHISSIGWPKLKQLWNVKSKSHGNRYTSAAAAETKPPVDETPGEPFKTGPMNKRTGTRALWRF